MKRFVILGAFLAACGGGGGSGGSDGAAAAAEDSIPAWTLDSTYGGDGIVVRNLGGHERARAVRVDAEGRIVVAGDAFNLSWQSVAVVWRFDALGRPDATFGDGGVVWLGTAGGSESRVKDMAIDPSGRIVVCGYIYSTDPTALHPKDAAAWRLLPDGTLDTSFDGDGVFLHHSAAGGNAADTADGVAIDASGRILLVGGSVNAESIYNFDLAVWCLDDHGAIQWIAISSDAGGDGAYEYGNAVVLDSAGRIVVAGRSSRAGTDVDLCVWRFLSDGSLDTAFGGTGYVFHSGQTSSAVSDEALSVAIDPTGGIVAGGYSSDASGKKDVAAWHILDDGSIDNFILFTGPNDDEAWEVAVDAEGRIYLAGMSNEDAFFARHAGSSVWSVLRGGDAQVNAIDAAYAMCLDSSGRMVAAGTGLNPDSNADLVVWRFLADGPLDTTFDADGIASGAWAPSGSNHEGANAIVLDGQGRAVVAGWRLNYAGINDMIVRRFNTDGTPDLTFDGDGVFALSSAPWGYLNDLAFGVAIDSKGRILVTGTIETSSGNMDMAVWRFTEDGALDVTFDGDGWTTRPGDCGNAIAVDSQDRPVVAGYVNLSASDSDMALWRFTEIGALDLEITHHNAAGGGSFDYGRAVAVDSGILVAGCSRAPSNKEDAVVWRYKENGELEWISVLGDADIDDAFSIATDAAGRIWIGGYTEVATDQFAMAVWRLSATGAFEETFTREVSEDIAVGLAADGDRIVAVSLTGLVWRVDSDETFLLGSDARGIAFDAEGRILVAGTRRDEFEFDWMVVWRFSA